MLAFLLEKKMKKTKKIWNWLTEDIDCAYSSSWQGYDFKTLVKAIIGGGAVSLFIIGCFFSLSIIESFMFLN